MELDHPLVQSVIVPAAIGLAGTGLLRVSLGARHGPAWAAAAAGLAPVVAAGLLLGWRPSPGPVTEKLPWALAAAWLLGVALQASGVGARLRWLASSALWAGLCLWLGGSPGALAVALVGGSAVLAALLAASSQRSDGAAALAIACAGLAGVAQLAGSLVLFQLAAMQAFALAGAAPWLWPRMRVALGPPAVVGIGIAWLSTSYATALLTPAPPSALALLGLSAIAAWGVPRMTAGRLGPVAGPLATGVVAALLAGVALVLTGSPAGPADGGDDYYQRPE